MRVSEWGVSEDEGGESSSGHCGGRFHEKLLFDSKSIAAMFLRVLGSVLKFPLSQLENSEPEKNLSTEFHLYISEQHHKNLQSLS